MRSTTPKVVEDETRVPVDDPHALRLLTLGLWERLKAFPPSHRPATVVCVGSDRSTGDSLGPLVGSRLEQIGHPGIVVRGSLESPVHAANLAKHVQHLAAESRRGIVVAVDACLGKPENVGTVCVKPGPLRPGTGVNKELPPVGHFHVVGVVNVGGFMEYFVLQNTRLSLVMRLADLIARSLYDALALRWAENRSLPAADLAATVEP